MCNAYAANPFVEGGTYIAQSLTRQAHDVGVLLLYVPDCNGFRNHCMVELEKFLSCLQQHQLCVVSMG